MQSRTLNGLPHAAATVFALLANALWVGSASAHVKWFCAFDVVAQPRGLENVLCQDFEILVGLGVLALFSGCLLEGTPVGAALTRALDRVTALPEPTWNRFFGPFAEPSSSRYGSWAAFCSRLNSRRRRPRSHGCSLRSRRDHLLLSPQAADRLAAVGIERDERGQPEPSDHVPVWCELEIDPSS